MDELLSMIDELKSKGISINELQLQKFIEVYHYLENAAKEFGGLLEQPTFSMEGCEIGFRSSYFCTYDQRVFADLLRCCSRVEFRSSPGLITMRFLIPGVFMREAV